MNATLPICFGYTIGCVAREGSKHSSNILNFPNGKQYSTDIMMAFASDSFLEKKFDLTVVRF